MYCKEHGWRPDKCCDKQLSNVESDKVFKELALLWINAKRKHII